MLGKVGRDWSYFFFFQAEDGIRDGRVTGVQTCALPISARPKSTWKTVVGIVEPPGLPRAKPPRPGTSAIAGHIAESILLPGAIALTSPATTPKAFGSPGRRSEERRVGEEGRSRWSAQP